MNTESTDFRRVYYLTEVEHAISNIKHQRIKVSDFDSLNDPYELLAAKSNDPEFRKFQSHNKNYVKTKVGLICFSETYENPVMWSHYGKRHSGVCLGFDVKTEYAFQVTYNKQRTFLSNQEISNQNGELRKAVIDSLKTKYIDWAYEKEVRMLLDFKKDCFQEDGKYFYRFGSDLVLKEVLLGVNCENSVSEFRKKCGENLSIHQTRLAWTKYAVIKKKVPKPS